MTNINWHKWLKSSFLIISLIYGQSNAKNKLERIGLNPVTSAVPFLIIAPDAKSGGMGELGAATEPDFASIHWNIAKAAFLKEKFLFSISYTPWFRNIVNDMYLGYLSLFKKTSEKEVMGCSLRYFSLGMVEFTDNTGTKISDYKPHEFAIDGAYSILLSEKWSGGIALRYIYSDLTGRLFLNNAETKPGQTMAFDVGILYNNNDLSLLNKKITFRWGLQFANIGAKITYSTSGQKDFLPAMFRTGTSQTLSLDDKNNLTLSLDIHKLMVPTPQISDTYIIRTQMSVPVSLIKSWYDAPAGFKEEIREFNWAVGLEYSYTKQISFRSGFFWEHSTKGNRRFVNLGASLTYNIITFHISYLMPVFQGGISSTANPLANTIRFSLVFNFVNEEPSNPKN